MITDNYTIHYYTNADSTDTLNFTAAASTRTVITAHSMLHLLTHLGFHCNYYSHYCLDSNLLIAIAVVVAVVGPDHPNLKPGIGNPTRQLGFVDIASPDSSTHWDLGCSSWRHNSTALHSIGLVADIVLVNIMHFGFHFA